MLGLIREGTPQTGFQPWYFSWREVHPLGDCEVGRPKTFGQYLVRPQKSNLASRLAFDLDTIYWISHPNLSMTN